MRTFERHPLSPRSIVSTPTPRKLRGFRLVAVIAGGGCAALIVLMIIIGIIVSAANGTLGRGVPEETSTAVEATSEPADPSRAQESPSGSAAPSAESSEPSTEAATSQAEPVTASAPAECLSSFDDADATAYVEHSDMPLAEPIAEAELPDGLADPLVLIVKVDSDLDPTFRDVVVRVCGAPLDEEEQRRIATYLAIVAHRADADGVLTRFFVQFWEPGRDGSAVEARNLYVDTFQSYTWDRNAAVPPEQNWDSRDA